MRSVDLRSRMSGGGRSVAPGAVGAQRRLERGDGPCEFEAKSGFATLEVVSALEGSAR